MAINKYSWQPGGETREYRGYLMGGCSFVCLFPSVLILLSALNGVDSVVGREVTAP